MNHDRAGLRARHRRANSPRRSKPDSGYGNRVAVAHQQARIGLAVTLAFAASAAVAGVVPHNSGPWLALHLFLVGSLLAAISSATQLIAVTWSSSPPTSTALALAQLLCLGGGAIAVAAGREFGADLIVGIGGAAVIVALGLLALILRRIRSTAHTDRFAPAIEAYIAAIGFAVAGSTLGVLTALGRSGSWWTQTRGAHIDANVFGFVGLIVAATVPYFVATQARMKMSPRATPRRLHILTIATVCAVGAALSGRVVEQRVMVGIGYGVYAGALVWLVTLLPRAGRRQLQWAGPRLVQLAAGLGWWFAMTVLLAVNVLADIPDRTNVVRALIIGGYAQILAASLAYFGPVLRGGGHKRLSEGFATTRSWISLVVGNTAGVGALSGHRPTLIVSLSIWAFDIAVRCLRLAAPLEIPSRSREDPS